MSAPGYPSHAEPAMFKPKRSWRQRTFLTVGTTVVLLALSSAALAGFLLAQLASIEREDLDITLVAPGSPQNFLLVGSDRRADASLEHDVGGQRSDTIMVARVDPGEETAAVLSIPRDLVVPIAGTGQQERINAAYAAGSPEEGRQILIDTIRENLGIEINAFVEVEFEGFARLVDAVGGVPLHFDAAVRDTASGLYQDHLGCVTLDGDQALAFVRSRQLQIHQGDGRWETDPTADLGRVARQQVFIRQAVSQLLSTVRSDPRKVLQLVDIGTDSLTLDQSLSVSDIRDLADRLGEFDQDNLDTFALPTTERGDGATLALDRQAAEPILNVFRGLDPGELSPALVRVHVLNGTGEDGQANDAAGALQRIGFDVVDARDAPEPHERTTIYHRPDDELLAERLARHVTGGAVLATSDDPAAGEVHLVTGGDLTTFHQQPTPFESSRSGGDEDDDAGSGAATDDDDAEPEAGRGDDDGATTTTTAPPTTTTTALSNSIIIGTPPPGADCG